MLTPFDDYPVHQTPLPIAHAGGGHPITTTASGSTGYTEDYYFALSLGIYPNAASSTRRSVSSTTDGSGRCSPPGGCRSIPPVPRSDRSASRSPIRCGSTGFRVDAADLGITADLTFQARTAAFAEPRQTLMNGTRPLMDVTRLAQMANGPAPSACRGGSLTLDEATVYGTKDRSWGIRLRCPARHRRIRCDHREHGAVLAQDFPRVLELSERTVAKLHETAAASGRRRRGRADPDRPECPRSGPWSRRRWPRPG